MRTIFYLAIAIAALFILSSEARPMRKRAETNSVDGLLSSAGGEPLGSLTGVTGGVVSAKSQQTPGKKKKRRNPHRIPLTDFEKERVKEQTRLVSQVVNSRVLAGLPKLLEEKDIIGGVDLVQSFLALYQSKVQPNQLSELRVWRHFLANTCSVR